MQSYFTKFSELKTILNEFKPKVMCLQETMIRNRIANPPSQYQILTSVPRRDDNHERGAAILINKNVNYEHLPLNSQLQVVAAKVYLGKAYTICSIYLPHVNISLQEIESLIDELPRPFILIGDMNARNTLWHDVVTNHKGQIIEQILNRNDINIINSDSPTHYHLQTGSTSVIDLAMVSSDCSIDYNHGVLSSLHGSDHYPTYLNKTQPNFSLDKHIRFKIEQADWVTFHNNTNVVLEENINNVDDEVEFITQKLHGAACMAIPRSSGRLMRPPVPWWNADCDNAKRERTRAERAVKRQNNLHNRVRYKRAKAICKQIFDNSKKNSWTQYLNSINSRTNINSVWKKIKKLSNKFQSSPTPILKNNNQVVDDKSTVAEIFAEHFVEMSNTSTNNITFSRHKTTIENSPLNMTDNNNEYYNHPFQWMEFTSALKQSKESSPGPDEITYSMIKMSHPTMQERILNLYNTVYTSHSFPTNWRTSVVLPFKKPGKNPHNKDNYRPISLSSCLCKVMGKMVNQRLMYILERTGKITPMQSGFQRNRSTTDNLVCLEKALCTAVLAKEHTLMILFDLKKAYDTAWKHNIVKTLHEYGVRGNLLYYIEGFLKDRKIKVRIGSKESNAHVLYEGIPQGSVLSCTCFLIAINGILDSIPQAVQRSLYVDDLALYCSGRNVASIRRLLQLSLNHLQRWSDKTGFTFSPTKTISIHICRERGCLKASPEFEMYNEVLPHVQTAKYLGLTIDSSLTWKPHIKSLKTSCSKTLNLLKTISNLKYGADKKTLVRLLIAMIKPKLDYGCEAYSSAARTTLQIIDPIFNASLRVATGAFRTSPVPSLICEAGILPIKYYREIKMMNYFARIYCNSNQYTYSTIANINMELFNHNQKKPQPFYVRCKTLLDQNAIEYEKIEKETLPENPPWTQRNMKVCHELFDVRRSSMSEPQLKQIFLEHFRTHINTSWYFTDGSKDNNATSFATVNIHKNQVQANRISNTASIFTSELLAIESAIEQSKNDRYNIITICTDSKSSAQGIDKYGNRHSIIISILNKSNASNKQYNICWCPSHTGITGNERADRAAKNALTSEVETEIKLPREDIKIKIKKKTRNKWQQIWYNTRHNKLRTIKETTKPLMTSYQSNRQWEVKLTRLRIGHTKLTHSFLLTGEPPPTCDHAQCNQDIITVKHVLIECNRYHVQRMNHFRNLDFPFEIDKLLGDTGPVQYRGPLFNYLHDINIYYEI